MIITVVVMMMKMMIAKMIFEEIKWIVFDYLFLFWEIKKVFAS